MRSELSQFTRWMVAITATAILAVTAQAVHSQEKFEKFDSTIKKLVGDDVTPDELPVASITISDSRGLPVNMEAAAGQMLVVSAEKARHAGVDGSLRWIIEPSCQTWTSKDGAIVLITTDKNSFPLRIMQIVGAKSGRTNWTDVRLTLIPGPTPDPIDPTPKPPVPPGPNPPPQPPGPNTSPFVEPGFRVLIIEETSQRPFLAAAQQAIFTSTAIRAYTNSHCVKGPDGKTPEFRIFDKDSDVSRESEVWRKAAVLASQKQPTYVAPYLLVGNGKEGYAGLLPKSEADLLTLLKKYGGE